MEKGEGLLKSWDPIGSSLLSLLFFLDPFPWTIDTKKTMASKATQEYRVAFITLLTQLSEIERRGQEFFDKM